MGRLYILFFLVPLAVSLPTPLHGIGGGASRKLILKACNATLYYDVCLETLLTDPASRKVDLKGLAMIALKAANRYGNATSTYIGQLRKIINDPYLKECLNACSECYLDAIYSMEDSEVAMQSKNYYDVNIWVSAAMSYSQSCEQGFKDRSGYRSLLANRDRLFSQMCSNVLDITELLK